MNTYTDNVPSKIVGEIRSFVDLDCCADYVEYAGRFDCETIVLAENGPTGWPFVRFVGTPENVTALLAEYNAE